MNKEIKHIGIIGGGVMGLQLAEYFAQCRCEVVVIEKDERAVQEVNSQLRAGKFGNQFLLEQIQVGTLEQCTAALKKCDLILECVSEDIQLKKQIFLQIQPYLNENCLLASNTSGFSRQELAASLPKDIQSRFCILHFFNPVNRMPLVEVCVNEHISSSLYKKLIHFAEVTLGKRTLIVQDTPGFIANRVGLHHWLTVSRLADTFSIEELDAVFGSALGFSMTGIFQTADLVGIDTLYASAKFHITATNTKKTQENFTPPKWLEGMIQARRLGAKTKQGFYRQGAQKREVFDLKTGEYREVRHSPTYSPSQLLHELQQPTNEFFVAVLSVLSTLFQICSFLVGSEAQVASSLLQIDEAMRFGYGWEAGPFELWQRIGVDRMVSHMISIDKAPATWVTNLLEGGHATFYQNKRTEFFNTQLNQYQKAPLSQEESWLNTASLMPVDNRGDLICYDLGDDVFALVWKGKKNLLHHALIEKLEETVNFLQTRARAVVFCTQNPGVFSLGADLSELADTIDRNRWDLLEHSIRQFQQFHRHLKMSRVPIVARLSGRVLGGAAELALHVSARCVTPDLKMGFPESRLGLLPAAGGCAELLSREMARMGTVVDPMLYVRPLFENLALGRISTHAEDARHMHFLADSDRIVSPVLSIRALKQWALGLAEMGYFPTHQPLIRAAGIPGFALLEALLNELCWAKKISDHDKKIGLSIAHVLTGGRVSQSQEVSVQHILDLEAQEFLRLCGEEKTRARIEFMLKYKLPLFN